MKPKQPDFYKAVVKTVFTDQQYWETFRMGKVSFHWLKQALKRHIKGKHTNFKKPLSCGQQLCTCLLYLSTGASFKCIAIMMHSAPSTVQKAVHGVNKAICNEFHSFCAFPTTIEGMKQNAAGFYKRGTKRGGAGVLSRLLFMAMQLTIAAKASPQLMCMLYVIILDGFIEVLVGNPGSMHDSNVFRSSNFWRSIHNGLGSVLWTGRSLVLGTQVPFQIIADSAYACTSFVLPAFKDGVAGQDRNKKRFNRKHAATRNVVERAFGRLKTRWRALLKENELQLKNQNFMIYWNLKILW